MSLLQSAERELDASKSRIHELELYTKEVQSDIETTRGALRAMEEQQPEVATLQASLRTAQADAAAAASQLIDACEENARLSEELSLLHAEIEKKERHRGQRVVPSDDVNATTALARTIKEDKSTMPHVSGAVLVPHTESVYSVGSTTVTDNNNNNNKTRGASPPTPQLTRYQANSQEPDPEDLLAMEVSRLRHHALALESQLATAQEAAPVLAALEKENAVLKITAERATGDAVVAQSNLNQLQAEARVLYGQLSEVIASLAATKNHNGGPRSGTVAVGGLPLTTATTHPSSSPIIVPALGATSSHQGDAHEDGHGEEHALSTHGMEKQIPLPSHRDRDRDRNRPKNRHRLGGVDDIQRRRQLEQQQLSPPRPSSSRHENTSTSNAAGAATAATATAADVDDVDDMVIADLRSAMAQLDSALTSNATASSAMDRYGSAGHLGRFAVAAMGGQSEEKIADSVSGAATITPLRPERGDTASTCTD